MNFNFSYFIKKYYRWRYWRNIYINMVQLLKKEHTKSNKTLIPYINKPGIVLSFDDSYRVDNWYAYGKKLFEQNDIKVTFNINGTHPLEDSREHNQMEIDQLLELQSYGHEIGHHGFNHQKAIDYSNRYSYDKWIKDEIEKLFNWMEKKSHSKTKQRFKRPVSFAFPHFIYNDKSVAKLVPKYFKIIRGHLNMDNLIEFNYTGFAPSICLDSYYGCSTYYIKKIIRLAKKSNKNLILTCHSILPLESKIESELVNEKAKKWGTWRVTPNLIQIIVNETKKNDMEFYTMSDIAGIATFIDRNLEKAVRNIISNSNENKWIEISELSKVKELDLSNKGISDLNGIEYFINLEKLNLKNNNISDFRLLKKLSKLKSVNIDENFCTQEDEEEKKTMLRPVKIKVI